MHKIAWIKFFFHKDMKGKSAVAIEKEWAQLAFCLSHGGMNAVISPEG